MWDKSCAKKIRSNCFPNHFSFSLTYPHAQMLEDEKTSSFAVTYFFISYLWKCDIIPIRREIKKWIKENNSAKNCKNLFFMLRMLYLVTEYGLLVLRIRSRFQIKLRKKKVEIERKVAWLWRITKCRIYIVIPFVTCKNFHIFKHHNMTNNMRQCQMTKSACTMNAFVSYFSLSLYPFLSFRRLHVLSINFYNC